MTTLSGASADGARPRPTMKDVAALAGVSLKTVSRVVNEEPGVSDDLVDKVRRAAAQLDYRHNLAASNLRRADRKTSTVGLLLEDVANPYSSTLHRAVEDQASPRGVAVFAASVSEDPERERVIAEEFLARRVDGLIVMPAGPDHSYLRNDQRAGTAIVFVDRPPQHLDADVVLVDNEHGAAQGVAHLLEHGHRRIAYLGDRTTISTSRERLAGYHRAMAAGDVPVDDDLVVTGLHTTEAAEAAATRLLRLAEPPTAVFAGQNLVTIGVIRALRALGLEHAIAVVGFDDFMLADLLEPAVTVVAQDPTEVGRVAAQTLFRRLDGDTSPTTIEVVPTRLVPRGSGEIPPR